MTRILLVRHGQSEWNATGRWQGQADPPLTDLGRQQALSAAANVGAVDGIFASPLIRAHHTAHVISEQLGVGPVALLDGLMERDAGLWSGLTKPEIEHGWPGYLASGKRPPGYESDASILERVRPALHAIATVHPGGDVLALTHGGVIHTISHSLGLETPSMPNLGSRWLEVRRDGEIVGGSTFQLISDELATVPGQI